ncbi:MAG: hypothetical protein EBQ70_04685 [Betaproteobacteria bacterium]|nr:hypothetical protein [Betaproteobacteria bacterium]
MLRFFLRAVFTLLALGSFSLSFSQATYPDKPIRLVVPYPPGGFTDILGRLLASQLQPRLGQNVIVDNKGGGGSTIGTNIVARAPADGYTLLLVAPDLAINESLMPARLSYDAARISVLLFVRHGRPWFLSPTLLFPQKIWPNS